MDNILSNIGLFENFDLTIIWNKVREFEKV